MSHGIVDAMGGRLAVHNRNEGACFEVWLPIYKAN